MWRPLRLHRPATASISMSSCEKLTEQEIVSRIAKGDISAKKYLYCQYAGYLTGVCSRYITDAEDVKDILQESFLKIFSSINAFEYRGPGSLKGWMTRIVVNESLRLLKSVCRFELIPLSDGNEDIAEEEPDIYGIPVSELHSMIRELPIGYRTVLNLFVFEGKSHKEIANILGIKENTSASQFHRAKNFLAEKIKKYNHSNTSIAYER